MPLPMLGTFAILPLEAEASGPGPGDDSLRRRFWPFGIIPEMQGTRQEPTLQPSEQHQHQQCVRTQHSLLLSGPLQPQTHSILALPIRTVHCLRPCSPCYLKSPRPVTTSSYFFVQAWAQNR
ncbi:hypothetical protein VDGL01_11408 [Verticillium dahliae]